MPSIPRRESDLARVNETLDILSPRWTAWVLMTMAPEPLRPFQMKSRMPWMSDPGLHGILNRLVDAGVAMRDVHNTKHVTYSLSDRGADLIPVLSAMTTWASQHLERSLVRDATGTLVREPIPAAQQAEDALVLISGRYATEALWRLRSQGWATADEFAEQFPAEARAGARVRLSQLRADGLVETAAGRYRLTEPGQALAPVYRALSAWALWADPTATARHPVWDQRPRRTAVSVSTSNRSYIRPRAQWQSGDIFSHGTVASGATAPAAGGPRR
ncbi:winged helix-turn-helix transcriptional regulator [Streptomyces sp. MS19]|uniref:winged helix-turn-helix transcriptional regulator n=1 Tax=Streptomyces sp. MS19 TaxID=3385972 RepID=UPI0039A355E7